MSHVIQIDAREVCRFKLRRWLVIIRPKPISGVVSEYAINKPQHTSKIKSAVLHDYISTEYVGHTCVPWLHVQVMLMRKHDSKCFTNIASSASIFAARSRENTSKTLGYWHHKSLGAYKSYIFNGNKTQLFGFDDGVYLILFVILSFIAI